jgi:peroxiredoxin
MQARSERFEARTPAIGDPMPDLSAYDEEGGKFELSSLKGGYSVLVFGCLT